MSRIVEEKDVFGIEITPFWRRYLAKGHFRVGNPLGVDECVLACHEDGEAIPDWAVEELARRARINLGIDEPPPKKGGRHTNPNVQFREEFDRTKVCCAVLAARSYGIPKEKSYDKAKELLEVASKLNRDRDSIKTIFRRHGSNYRDFPLVKSYEAVLELVEDGRLDEFIEEHVPDKKKALI